MPESSLPALAETIARRAHEGQNDKSGADYITHPARVAANVSEQGGSEEAVAVAWLHDVLEDCAVTSSDLLSAGIPQRVIDAVISVTKREGEQIEDYCARVRANPIGLMVKYADLADNTSPERTALLEDAVRTRLAEKYAYVHSLLAS
ncbi:phosphohydrolase [Arthrobacter sp. MYb211]|uniref:HD domain-containing protein n=1 Tax=Micrococcaceae TaxID=1268 RepID=UPI000CFB0C8B|nr:MULTISPECIES: HD domain-containing protein [unclassified Arthrobacter]PQZ97318.1 phosphohydrolase [Arthrobacter sp. MYb224]PRA10838.1 phosphohydrolase [Arthrobacter sp. MYb221]PRC06899.1 phosphohydrolase [Arthrobacter sp. MYb211]